MAPPPAKKQKTDDIKSPIVFPCPGQKPDVRLIVFDQEFHINSTLLKLNSAFFRKFLDSTNKTVVAIDPTSSSSTLTRPETSQIGFGSVSTFEYEWVTKIDEGGEKWFLTIAFEKLMCAIYTRPYQLINTKELLLMTALADYYCALPILTRILDGAFINSPQFCKGIGSHASELFVAAAKIRNALLFRECLIWVVISYRDREFESLEDKRLRMIVRCAHGEVSTRLTGATAVVLTKTADT
ncbi:uncharacterized protein LY89DRAFT_574625 [Mollisia scopiformis]|uniref:BTB domain-containing protein n=1 Tax=Mollisia scopiformis TaxID=149040 RepID=A0A194XQ92_MOLSC|nr:uncharacterized protein LY89DRAFT_574625 [Mollisia scopiformis]KUJ22224.1 hypothetical protein LY89DRAFT_574625 [Mollisia scopiformis]